MILSQVRESGSAPSVTQLRRLRPVRGGRTERARTGQEGAVIEPRRPAYHAVILELRGQRSRLSSENSTIEMAQVLLAVKAAWFDLPDAARYRHGLEECLEEVVRFYQEGDGLSLALPLERWLAWEDAMQLFFEQGPREDHASLTLQDIIGVVEERREALVEFSEESDWANDRLEKATSAILEVLRSLPVRR